MATFIVDGKVRELTMRDTNGIDWSNDFIGNTSHGMENDDEGNYIASTEEYEWWKAMIADWEDMQEKIEEYKETYGSEEVTDWLELSHAWSVDLEDQPNSVRSALAEMDEE